MKKVSIFLLAIFAFASVASAQLITFELSDEDYAPGAIQVPLTASTTAGITSIDMRFDYNTAFLTFNGISNAITGISAIEVQPGEILVFFTDGGSPANTIPSGVSDYLLFDLDFSFDGNGTSLLVFNEGNYIINTGSPQTNAAFVNGAVRPEGSATLPLSNWAIFVGLGLIVAFLVVRFRKLV